ncbi:hypothetical protein HDV05_001131 [Chytridiales sp. JEL 0842]|nr:hypothetical protein HDV05_001131 [Chytridiales sp. JEL 0842]
MNAIIKTLFFAAAVSAAVIPDQNTGTPTIAQVGQRCGGNISTAAKCAEGLTCKPTGSLPIGDVGGICVKILGINDACVPTSFAQTTEELFTICEDQLQCYQAQLDATTGRTVGRCFLVSGHKGDCGGFVGTGCEEGLQCVRQPFSTAGTCEYVAKAGQRCGGTLTTARVCEEGFKCENKLRPKLTAMLGGVCIKA